ncbi:hypothetical protein LX64_01706 [Chitinophaga skermanii]|uniref:ZU5 domain-containing protein n=1 Tax=Chitinophaga skermanii TaxID=331697 RepID=A0A327QPS7_9BACT|nr:hypothetical protein [Chitinophaga skermanii]RAJ06579.1 hypothetical protein LX64_01706 [Chitinophaga skermanii]
MQSRVFDMLKYIILFTTYLLTACTKTPADPNTPNFPTVEDSLVTTKGATTGDKISKVIGPAGGTLSTTDGLVNINIPAGALTAATEVSITPIQNTNPGGLGTAYRLLPHGEVFKQPVTVSFKYENIVNAGTYTKALGVAYQDDRNIWQYVGASQINTTNKTIQVQTTHFSDWTLMLWMYLTPQQKTIGVKEQAAIKAVRVLPVAIDASGLLVPLVPPGKPGIPVGKQKPLESKYIKKWDLNGAGVLESAPGSSNATYLAPNNPPNQNPVTVSLQLNVTSAQVFLLSHITVLNENYIEFTVNGSKRLLECHVGKLKEGHYAVAHIVDETGEQINLHWNGGVGTHAYQLKGNGGFNTMFEYFPAGRSSVYGSFYLENPKDNEVKASGGGVTVTDMGEVSGYVEGTFTVAPSGQFNMVGQQIGTSGVTGKFKVKRTLF